MTQTLFALFDSPAAAAEVTEEIRRIGTPDAHCEVVTHAGPLVDADTSAGETAARSGALLGASLGGLLGALIGAILLQSNGLGAGAAVIIGAAGVLMGGAFGGIAGSASPDPAIARMAGALRRGGVLLTVRAPDRTSGERAERLLRDRGVQVQHPSLL